jgi:hypothetical protein
MIFGEEALKKLQSFIGGESALYVVKNDDGKSQCFVRFTKPNLDLGIDYWLSITQKL